MLKKIFYLIVFSTGILTGCSSTQTVKETVTPSPLWESTYQQGELNGESLYDLLIAELAGHQQQYDISLEKYLKQAELTGDPGVIRRAARIAQFTKNSVALEKAARIWVKYEPESNEPQTLLVGMLIQQGKFSTALPFIDKALATDSHPILALLNSRATKMSAADAQAYLDVLIKQSKITPKNSDLWLTRGVFERHLNATEAALISFDKAIRYNPEAETAFVQKADLLKDAGRFKEALAVISQWLDKDPENKQLIILKVQTLYKADSPNAAVKHSQQLISDYSTDNQLHLYLALLALDFNRLDDSKSMLKTIFARTRDNTLNFYLGLIEEQQNNPELAIQHYLQVDRGNNILPSYNRSLALLSNAQDETRVNTIMENAINKHANLAPDLINLHADWLRSFDFNDKAISRLSEGVSAYPEHINLRYSRAMMRPPEEFPQSEIDFRFILEKEPDNAMALNALGYTLSLYTERYNEAYELLNRAIQIKPDDPAIMDSIGWVLFKLQRHEEALNYLQKAYKVYPDAEVGGHLIAVLVALNQRPKAQQIFTELSKKFPDSPHLPDAQRALNAPL
ncbi:tetratricopeptide repeat protein [Neptunomonas qingdaonensis]|uniref:Tetratricopeptide repeat-containing protein n=1 Tax=Neptunomonas qingdaonensis TaxID=1045558 RepID=A0A1I2U2Y3_9GAMM|nr:tetratricopeptide repeat protein [Neptunomonas qingdaonensis]SFG69216.1 Tetratricopeptide repeat-containing protein [Neptunomonas qingdaonensis]